MYAPLLRGKQNELIAFRELAERVALSDSILPIFEPVKANSTTTTSFDLYAAAGMRFMLIVNPQVGDFQNADDVEARLIEPSLSEYDNYFPAFYVNSATTVGQIQAFIDRYSPRGLELGVIYTSDTQPDVAAYLTETQAIRFHIFQEMRTSAGFRAGFSPDRTILLNDPFVKRERNADYDELEHFSDRHLTLGAVAGFGDYSIAGSQYADGGGAANAVALHHVYFSQGPGSALSIRHFVSDRTETAADVAGKFLEALQKLVTALPGLGEHNRTPTCAQYEDLLERGHFPGLGIAKKLALKHHFELFLQ